jgi:hypothetical protein
MRRSGEDNSSKSRQISVFFIFKFYARRILPSPNEAGYTEKNIENSFYRRSIPGHGRTNIENIERKRQIGISKPLTRQT